MCVVVASNFVLRVEVTWLILALYLYSFVPKLAVSKGCELYRLSKHQKRKKSCVEETNISTTRTVLKYTLAS